MKEVILETQHIPEQKKFYVDQLGLRLLDVSHNSLAFQSGHTKLVFWQSPGKEFKGYYHFAFGIPDDKFDQANSWIRTYSAPIANQRGIDEFFSDSWEAKQVYFYDPAGNIVEFIARAMPTSFAEDSQLSENITGMVEVGFTVPDVASAVDSLTSTTGISTYRNSISDNFAALGDQNGLLILAQHRRIWFPDTSKPAGYFPITVIVEAESGRHYWLDSPPKHIQVTELPEPATTLDTGRSGG